MKEETMDERKFFIFATAMALMGSGAALTTDPPVVSDKPFLFMWNAPTELCDVRFGMPLDLSYFDIISSTLKSATNQKISIFYTDRFGIFPYVDEETGEVYDDGLPQLVDMKEHHELAEDDIEYYIPFDQPGLAVLDFEEWRPQWIRNWGSKDIYRDISVELVKKKNRTLTEDQAEDRAKLVFERAAKKYFVRSIGLGKKMRPKRLWGYYLYPDCYNYDYNQDMEGFTGECPDIERERNDELMWLWKESTALFPSIYLELVLRDTVAARLFVRHRIHESLRVSMLPNGSYSIPIYAYIRPVYKDSTDDYMSEFDLVNTIGEAAALGAAGVISWGDMNVTDSEDSCLDARRHLENVMNRYIVNITKAAQLCSQAICSSQGRCMRKRWDDDVYLHLDSQRYRIQQFRRGGPFTVDGGLSMDDVNWFDRHFDCMCFSRKPCRSALSFNDIMNRAVKDNRAADMPRSLLLLLTLLSLLYLEYVVF